MFRSGEILEENERLKEENRRLTQRQLEFDKYKLENEQLKEYLDIKEKNPDFDFETAFVIGRDPQRPVLCLHHRQRFPGRHQPPRPGDH